MNTATGRWHADDCSRALPFRLHAPQAPSGMTCARRHLARVADAVPRGRRRRAPPRARWAHTHSLPANMLQNNALRAVAAGAGVANVWLDYHRPATRSGCRSMRAT
jgi:hypothetical protein